MYTRLTEDQRAKLIDILKDMVDLPAGSAIDFNNLTKTQLRQILLSISGQLAEYYVSTDGVGAAISDGLDKTDVGYHTFLRLWQVFGNVIANMEVKPGSDDYNADSSFNQAVSNPGVAWSLGAASVIPAALGFYIRIQQMKEARKGHSIPKQQEILLKATGQLYLPDAIIRGYQDFCDRTKVIPSSLRWTDPEAAKTDKVIGTNPFANFIHKVRDSKPVSLLAEGWNFLGTTALFFWPAWMIAVLIVGIAASYAMPVLPIVVAVAFGVSIAVKAGLTYFKNRAKKKEEALYKDVKPEIVDAEKKELAQEIADSKQMTKEVRQRFIMKEKHAEFKRAFNIPEKNHARLGNGHTIAKNKDGVIIALKNNPQEVEKSKEVATVKPSIWFYIKRYFIEPRKEREARLQREKEKAELEKKELTVHKQKVDAVLQSKIGQRLLGSKMARGGQIAINMVNDIIGYYTLSSFILWLVGSAILTLTPVGAVFGFAGIGGLVLGAILPGISAGFSGIVGALYGLNAFANTRNKQLAFEKDIYTRLAEPYKNTGKTNQQAFDDLYAEVETLKADIKEELKAEQKRIQEKAARGNALDLKEEYLAKLNLNNIDVFNDYYMSTGEEKPSAWTRFKDVAFKTYKAINAGQTWIFVTRSLFLAGAALAGICALAGPAAGIAFIAIAVTMAVAGIAFKMAQIYTESKVADKKAFVEGFPVRLSYLEKMKKELTGVKGYLNRTDNTHAVVLNMTQQQPPLVQLEPELDQQHQVVPLDSHDANNDSATASKLPPQMPRVPAPNHPLENSSDSYVSPYTNGYSAVLHAVPNNSTVKQSVAQQPSMVMQN